MTAGVGDKTIENKSKRNLLNVIAKNSKVLENKRYDIRSINNTLPKDC